MAVVGMWIDWSCTRVVCEMRLGCGWHVVGMAWESAWMACGWDACGVWCDTVGVWLACGREACRLSQDGLREIGVERVVCE